MQHAASYRSHESMRAHDPQYLSQGSSSLLDECVAACKAAVKSAISSPSESPLCQSVVSSVLRSALDRLCDYHHHFRGEADSGSKAGHGSVIAAVVLALWFRKSLVCLHAAPDGRPPQNREVTC